MSAETSLYSALSGDAGVTAIVAGRVYPDVAPQGSALPAIVFERTQTDYLNTIHGTAIAQKASLEVWCMAETRAQAEALCNAVETAARTADFITMGRRAEFDNEQMLWATVLSVDFWE